MSEYNVGEIPPEQLKKQAKRYGLEDFVKGRVDKETLDRIAHKADELQRKNLSEEMKEPKTSYTEKMILGEEEKAIAEKAAKLIARDYDEVIKQLDEYERLEAEAEEIAEEDRVYRKKIVR